MFAKFYSSTVYSLLSNFLLACLCLNVAFNKSMLLCSQFHFRMWVNVRTLKKLLIREKRNSANVFLFRVKKKNLVYYMIVCVLLQSYNEETAVPVLETIFSPAFHMSKSAGGEIASGGRLGNTCTFLFPSSNAIMFLCSSTPKKLFSAILCIYLSHLSSLPFPFSRLHQNSPEWRPEISSGL